MDRLAEEFQRRLSESITTGVASNSLTVIDWSKWLGGKSGIDPRRLHESMIVASKKAENGDLNAAEAMLMAQALSLNAMFTSLAAQAHATQHFDHFDRFTRLARKAQGQCRATIETLAMMKNPPIFTKQANIASGPQQVNNGMVNNVSARAEIPESAPNKVLEPYVDRVDRCSQRAAAKSNPFLGALETRDRPADSGREATRVPQRLPRRRASKI